MKKKKIGVLVIVLISFILLSIGLILSIKQQKDIFDVNYEYDKIQLKVGNNYEIAKEYLNNSKDLKYFYKSSNTSVATIDEKTGTIIAKKNGEAIIYIMDDYNSSIYYAYKVYVSNEDPKTINQDKKDETVVKLNKKKTVINVGSSEKIFVRGLSENLEDIVWTSNDSSIATVSNEGLIYGVKEGQTIITAKDKENQLIGTIDVSVVIPTIKVMKISLNKSSISVAIGSKEKLITTISPEDATNKAVTWSSSNTSVATVFSDGTVKGIKEGTATITVKTNDGDFTDSVIVNVKPIYVKGVSLNVKTKSIIIDSTEKLIANVIPINATNKAVTWSSSDTSVATVSSDGTVKGIKEGTVIITVSTNDGRKTATATITVKPIPISKVALNKTSTTINVGSTEKITATITPTNATNKAVTWTSSNTNIATVSSDGTVKGIKEGTATITAKATKDDKKASITVNVVIPKIPVSQISVNKKETSISIGSTEKLTAIITPSNATNKAVTWTSSNASITTVSSDGTVKGIKEGTATITVKTNDGGKSATATVTVKPISVTNVSLNKTSTTIVIGSTEKLTATVTPINATNKAVTWTSSNMSVATVLTDGTVKGIKEGTAIITVKTNDGGKSATATVTVKPISVTNVSLNKMSTTIAIGSTEKLTATVTPTNATNKAVTWTSSNTSVATVSSDGTVKGIKEGTATITVKTNDGGKTAKATVTIKPISVTGISLNKVSMTIAIGSTEKLTATISPSNATNKTVTWTSSNTSIATVSSDGTVKGIKEGTATITVKTNDGGKSAKTTVTVKSVPVTKVSLNKTSDTIFLNSSNKTTKLVATITPTNATNKTVTWTSSNTNVATVNNNGVVTAKSLGTTTITVTSGGKTATCTINVKQKVIIVVGASQVGKMCNHVQSYTKNNNTYETLVTDCAKNSINAKGTLQFIYEGSTSFAYQVGNGFTIMKNYMNDNYSKLKKYVDFYIYFPIAGNGVAPFTCSKITASNSDIIGYFSDYNKKIKELKNASYSVKAYVVSVHPVKPSKTSIEKVVTNINENSCKASYRSNLKYYTFNKIAKQLVNNYNDLTYVETFTKIMKVNENGGSYSFLMTYTTIADGVHWDKATSKMYVNLMLDSNPNL